MTTFEEFYESLDYDEGIIIKDASYHPALITDLSEALEYRFDITIKYNISLKVLYYKAKNVLIADVQAYRTYTGAFIDGYIKRGDRI